jgi:hypothetical protein
MNINHNNYEEYFILYMDNELGADERRMVEAFVQQHPDLKEELDLLLQYKLEPDNSVVFDGKEELMKVNGETPISLVNYEEWMVLYNDNELTPAQKTMVEQFMIAHPSLQQEFDQLKRARLEPETLVFADKASLYRKEEKVRALPWWRIAAAAILLIGIGITVVLVINKKDPAKDGEVVKGTLPVIKTMEQAPVTNPGIANKENNSIDYQPAEKNAVVNPVPSNNKNIALQKNILPKEEKVKDIVDQDPIEQETFTGVNKKTNGLPASTNNPNLIKNNSTNTAIANHITSEIIPNKVVFAKNDVTPGDDESFDNEKNKSRGLFRKIARTFEKRAGIDPTDDNRLLVAGLAIKLK